MSEWLFVCRHPRIIRSTFSLLWRKCMSSASSTCHDSSTCICTDILFLEYSKCAVRSSLVWSSPRLHPHRTCDYRAPGPNRMPCPFLDGGMERSSLALRTDLSLYIYQFTSCRATSSAALPACTHPSFLSRRSGGLALSPSFISIPTCHACVLSFMHLSLLATETCSG